MESLASPSAATETAPAKGKLMDLVASELLKEFGKGGHKPGAGSAAVLQGMLSAQLLRTVISLTNESKRRAKYAQYLQALLKIDADVAGHLLPDLERWFQEDFELFGVVFRLRLERDSIHGNPTAYQQAANEALAALMPATEMPIQIAEHCLQLAEYALRVFDHGFVSARGDSGVAINSALGAVTGCLSIVELNLQSFPASEWAIGIRSQRKKLRERLNRLMIEAQRRLTQQVDASEMHAWFLEEIQDITSVAKARKTLSNEVIEGFVVRLQQAMWRNRRVLWKTNITKDPHAALDPKIAFKWLGFFVDRSPSLGQSPDGLFEVAGMIDQQSKVVSISDQFPRDTQSFTLAHELGHAMLHTQAVLHRDRPLDGTATDESQAVEEKQANKFATYFLMPELLTRNTFLRNFPEAPFRISDDTAFAIMPGPAASRTQHALRRQCKHLRGLSRLLAEATTYNGAKFTSLAESFKVSTEAMAIRLEELELVEF